MKRILHIVLFLLIGFYTVKAQQIDVCTIRNFNNSLLLSNQAGKIELARFTDYGELIIHKNENSRFLYQNQEWEKYLGLYFFDSRVYTPTVKRFFQPDPESQYHSVYLFVDSDPINIIDLDGRQGKPLILFQEVRTSKANTATTAKDFMMGTPDAYHFPISDFVSDRIGKLPEWNGNVYIKTHASNAHAEKVNVEQVYGNRMQGTNSPLTNAIWDEDKDMSNVYIDSEDFGEKLWTLAENNKVQVKNVFSGGCQGGKQAEKIADGYVKKATEGLKKGEKLGLRIRSLGLKKSFNFIYSGFITTRDAVDEGAKPFERSRIFIKRKKSPTLHRYEEDESGQRRLVGFDTEYIPGQVEPMSEIRPHELPDFSNARLPQYTDGYFMERTRIY